MKYQDSGTREFGIFLSGQRICTWATDGQKGKLVKESLAKAAASKTRNHLLPAGFYKLESYDNYPGCEKMLRWLTRCGGFPPELGSCTTPPPQERWNGYRVRWAASLLIAVDVTTSHHRYLSGHNHESPEEDVYKANKVLFLRAIIIFPIATTPLQTHFQNQFFTQFLSDHILIYYHQ